ncbi:hypothetical protein FHW12_003403 [Dokdonella fugitiva]|uniref:Uncharacterized protein n=1 Tax=Dokdonella fugitiva TaxID=328517 RepID=A0A839F7W3_9GAMM|nr:hypothetical protein [Dokdonella fugitiva]MBA8889160.1 hypothetical protein [Dokdonella fugitiva]
MIRHGVKLGALRRQIGLFRYRFEDEVVRGGPTLFPRLGHAGLEFVGQADGGAHEAFRSGFIGGKSPFVLRTILHERFDFSSREACSRSCGLRWVLRRGARRSARPGCASEAQRWGFERHRCGFERHARDFEAERCGSKRQRCPSDGAASGLEVAAARLQAATLRLEASAVRLEVARVPVEVAMMPLEVAAVRGGRRMHAA